MPIKRGLGFLIAAGLMVGPAPCVFAQAGADEVKQDEEPFVVPQFTDEEIAAHLKGAAEALASGEASAVSNALLRGPLIARGLPNNHALSDEQVKTIVAAAESWKKQYADHAETIDKYLFQVQNLTIGRQAPVVKGVDTDEVEFELTDYLGKVVVIDFWGDW